MRKIKKVTSAFLSALLAFSMTVVATESASAIIDANGCYAPGDNVKCGTNRYYFALPNNWLSEYSDTAGIYWYNGTDACGAVDGSGSDIRWPGYKPQRENCQYDNYGVYYVDCPADVPQIIWNNYTDGGEDEEAPVYQAAKQTNDAPTEFYVADDSDLYDDGWFAVMERRYNSDDKSMLGDFADNFFYDEEWGLGFALNFDNMIFIPPTEPNGENFNGKPTYNGDWYFYYGNGWYGTYPTIEEAQKCNALYNLNGQGKIYFDAKKSGWNLDFNIKYFCNIWRADEKGYYTLSQSTSELCTFDKTTGIVTYDLSKTDYIMNPDDGAIYNVVFSSITGMQTYTAVMSGNCIGDTLYCTGEQIENPWDCEKKSYVAVWENNPDCGPEKIITSTGHIVGTKLNDGETDETLLADYLICYYDDYSKTEMMQSLINELEVAPADVFLEVINRCNNQNAIQTIANILMECSNPKENIIGDVDGNGVVSVSDATLIQKYTAELTEFTNIQIKVADVNGDGAINVLDATAVQQMLVGRAG